MGNLSAEGRYLRTASGQQMALDSKTEQSLTSAAGPSCDWWTGDCRRWPEWEWPHRSEMGPSPQEEQGRPGRSVLWPVLPPASQHRCLQCKNTSVTEISHCFLWPRPWGRTLDNYSYRRRWFDVHGSTAQREAADISCFGTKCWHDDQWVRFWVFELENARW